MFPTIISNWNNVLDSLYDYLHGHDFLVHETVKQNKRGAVHQNLSNTQLQKS